MGDKKKSSLEEIDEKDDESLGYTEDSISMGASINFGLTQTKANFGDKLNNLA